MNGEVHAELGEEVVITRGGIPHPDSLVEQALAELTSIRSRATTGPESLKELINRR